jgi:hypothetical protein
MKRLWQRLWQDLVNPQPPVRFQPIRTAQAQPRPVFQWLSISPQFIPELPDLNRDSCPWGDD